MEVIEYGIYLTAYHLDNSHVSVCPVPGKWWYVYHGKQSLQEFRIFTTLFTKSGFKVKFASLYAWVLFFFARWSLIVYI